MRLDRIIQNRTDIGNKSYQCERNGDDAKNRFVIHDCLILFAEHQKLVGKLQNDLIGKTKCPIYHLLSKVLINNSATAAPEAGFCPLISLSSCTANTAQGSVAF